MVKNYKILLIDDSENDVILIIRALNQKLEDIEYFRVDTREGLTSILEKEREWDLIITDNVLPQLFGKEAVEIIRNEGIIAPIICISGSKLSHNLDECLRAGANGFALKDDLNTLVTLSIGLLENQHEKGEKILK